MTRFEELKLKAQERLSDAQYRELASNMINKDKGTHSDVYMLPLGLTDSLDYFRFKKYGMV